MKGFTLVELLVTIIILGLVLAIAVPSVINSINSSSENLYKQQISELKKTAEKWVINNTGLVSQDADFSYCVSVDELIKSGYITNEEVIDPKTKKVMNGCVEITYDEEYNQYEYAYKEETRIE